MTRWAVFQTIESIHPEKLVDKNYVKQALQEAASNDKRPEHLQVAVNKKELNAYIKMLMEEFCP